MSSRIDVSIEHRNVPEPPGKQHPNTCPQCSSHYRDDELEAALWVCPHCGHHFAMRARARIASLADEGTFVEEAADLRSEDPLDFFVSFSSISAVWGSRGQPLYAAANHFLDALHAWRSSRGLPSTCCS